MHASVRALRSGCQHDAGSMQFRIAISWAFSILLAGISPNHGIIGTT